ncbi:MAG: LytTR family DNA-binding domain-containing protein [Bryobacteraceae bacterium]
MRTLIVDDEPLARKVLREELETFAEVEIVGEASDGMEAVSLVRELRPDLAFLDLQMPKATGFEVIRQLDSGPMPVIIIVTAYDQHAIAAFEAGAIDYLLKPVSADRLATAVERAARITSKPREVAEYSARLSEVANSKQSPPPRKIVGRIGEEYFLLTPEEILAFQAEGDLVWIITSKRRYLATSTLKVLQERLQGLSFQRIHRNSLVNVTHVRKMAALSSQRWLLTLNNNLEFVVSKRQAGSVRSILS